MWKKRVRDSLTVKIFLLTMGLLLLVSMITYGSIAAFLPVTYQNELEEELQKVTEELQGELERYTSVEEAWNLLQLFAATNQAQVTLLDSSGNLVFPVAEVAASEAEESVQEEALLGEGTSSRMWAEVWEDDMTVEEAAPGKVEWRKESTNAQEDAGRKEGNPEAGEGTSVESVTDVYSVSQDAIEYGGVTYSNVAGAEEEVWDMALSQLASGSPRSAIKNYPVKIGAETYSMLVMGTMQSVSQTIEILRQILPTILLVILGAALICGAAASVFLTRPIMGLSRVSQKMAALQFDERCPETRTDEVGVLARSLNELTENLDAAMSELRESNQKLRAFFAAASHELKTPVTILKGHLGGMCQNMGAYRDRAYYLQRSYEVTETMERMVGEILAVSRMESGTWEAHREMVDLAELVRLQLAELVELLEGKSMEWKVDLPEHLNWRADRDMMEKVFRNLLVNSIRYSPQGARVELVMRQQGEELLFWIENTGVHLPGEALNRIFDAFYRVEDSRNRKSGGSGLGLYIVKMMLEQHGAVYGAENTREGVRIWFRMPF